MTVVSARRVGGRFAWPHLSPCLTFVPEQAAPREALALRLVALAVALEDGPADGVPAASVKSSVVVAH